jgi:hypothetical protein
MHMLCSWTDKLDGLVENFLVGGMQVDKAFDFEKLYKRLNLQPLSKTS